MDFILELVLSLLVEGSFELTKSRKIPKIIRVALAVFLIGFYGALVGLMIVIGVKMLNRDIKVSIVFFAVALFLIVSIAVILRRNYKKTE